jgi:glycosyltransferase involved in cell wall biosynthesis
VSGQARTDTEVDGVHIHRIPINRIRGVGRLTHLPLSCDRVFLAREVARELRSLRVEFDVCESPEWMSEGLLLPRRLPLVVRLHLGARHILAALGQRGLDPRLAITLEQRTIARAEVVVGTPAQLSAVRLSRSQAARAVCVELPVPIPTAPHQQVDPGLILFVGRFEHRKNPEIILRAAHQMRAEVPDARFVLVGRDTETAAGTSYLHEMERLREQLGVEQSVTFEDSWLEGEQLRFRLAGAAIVVMPSRWESFGLVAAEASALGRPVVAADLPSLRTIVLDGVTGRLVSPDEPSSWANALTRLLREPHVAERMGQAGVEHIRQRFSPERIAAQMLTVYETAIWRRGRER